MSHEKLRRRAPSILTFVLASALVACGDLPTAPGGAPNGLEPSLLIGQSPLFLADPRPSPGTPSGAGLEIEVDVSKVVFGEDVDRYAFRSIAVLRMSDGRALPVPEKFDPAPSVDASEDRNGVVHVTIELPFPRSVSDALAKEGGKVPTEVTVELYDARTGEILDRVQASKSIAY